MISYVYVETSITSPTEGSFSISSIPQGADIYIDSAIYSAKTPATIEHLVPKAYTIVLKKTGYDDYITRINAIVGQTTSINVTLIPKIVVTELEFPWWLVLGIGIGIFQAGKLKGTLGNVSIDSDPPGATVYIDGYALQDNAGNLLTTPVTVAGVMSGIHKIQISLDSRRR